MPISSRAALARRCAAAAIGRPNRSMQPHGALAIAPPCSQPSRCRHVRSHRHARGDCFAVQPVAVARRRLDRVAERVAEIQDRAQPVLALVDGDDLRLDLARAAHGVHHRGVLAREQRADVRFEPVEERRVADEAVLHDLREPGAIFPLRERARACACPRSRSAADGTRRSCSCRADD